MRSSRIVTNRKFPTALARKRAFGGAGDTRYASSTWLRSSRAQVWLSATTAAKRNATQISPPAMRRDSSALGSKAKLKITTTNNEKNSMELMASFERHSRRISFSSVDLVTEIELTSIINDKGYHGGTGDTEKAKPFSYPFKLRRESRRLRRRPLPRARNNLTFRHLHELVGNRLHQRCLVSDHKDCLASVAHLA